MQVFHTINALRDTLKPLRHQADAPKIALVPTMGNLHSGHVTLVKKAKEFADIVVVSVFVNPTQFGVGEDFDTYPRTLEADVAKLTDAGANFVFAPSVEEMYPTYPNNVQVLSGPISKILCANTRPTHFDGVGLVVSKLFNIVQPDIAVFGKKDYQQLAIIRQLVAELNFPIEIVGVDIVRAYDGLALSSRNQYLSEAERQLAPTLQKSLQQLANELKTANFADFDKIIAGAIDKLNRVTVADSGFKVDYLEVKNRLLQPPKPTDKDLVILTAAFLGKKTRLLDNLEFSRELNQEFSPELNQQLGQQSASDFNQQPTTASVKD
ncbi:pantoate--beta-alanine ligase [Moraxella osloensis]|nr:pantoate--beta-alanine ligase [Moraxella osloensis]ATW72058.1 pantoate--beta-alanine ligase [Moraxella osloensis]